MASLQQDGPSGRFRIRFYVGDREYKRSLKTKDPRVANSILGRVEETLRLIEQGRIEVPEGADLGHFVLADGKVVQRAPEPRVRTLGDLLDLYTTTYPAGAKEQNTARTEQIHFKHLRRLLGAGKPIRSLGASELQGYVGARLGENFRGKPIGPGTAKKEVETLRAVWNWAKVIGHVDFPLQTKGLVYPKSRQKPPFQTWDEIERSVSRGGMDKRQEKLLWDCLFLSVPEIEEVLRYVEARGGVPYVFPMFAFVAHTGARRSELLRSRVEDFNIGDGTVRIREKKKDRSKEETYRTVSLSPFLARVMKDWFERHPGGAYTLCRTANRGLSIKAAAKAFRSTLKGSKWDKIKGFHVFRHSFASNLARAGVDQRIIDEWMGHQTEEMRRRYRHLFPDQRREAIASVFTTR